MYGCKLGDDFLCISLHLTTNANFDSAFVKLKEVYYNHLTDFEREDDKDFRRNFERPTPAMDSENGKPVSDVPRDTGSSITVINTAVWTFFRF